MGESICIGTAGQRDDPGLTEREGSVVCDGGKGRIKRDEDYPLNIDIKSNNHKFAV